MCLICELTTIKVFHSQFIELLLRLVMDLHVFVELTIQTKNTCHGYKGKLFCGSHESWTPQDFFIFTISVTICLNDQMSDIN